jgi:hypothetical protein
VSCSALASRAARAPGLSASALAGRVGLGRGGADPHTLVEHGVEQARGGDGEALAGERAQLIARKDGDLTQGAAGLDELGRMAHVGRGEHLCRLALLDALAQQPGGRELGLDLDAGILRLEGGSNLGERRLEAAGGVETNSFGAGHGWECHR